MTSDAETHLLPGSFGKHLMAQPFHYATIILRVARMNSWILEYMDIQKIQILESSMVYAENNILLLISQLKYKPLKMIIKLCYITCF
jgi:hypothetical protein